MHNTAVSGTQIKTMWTLVSVVEIKQRWHQVPGSFGQRAASVQVPEVLPVWKVA